MRTVVVTHNRLEPLSHASGPCHYRGCHPDAVDSGFFVVCSATLTGAIIQPSVRLKRPIRINVANSAVLK